MSATAIRFQPDIHERLKAAAADHGVAINWLVNKACAEFLDRLLPADQVVWTRDGRPPHRGDHGDDQ